MDRARLSGWVLPLAAMGLACVPLAGCLDVDARVPDIYVDGGGPPPENVNSAQVPPTSSHEQARGELQKAYNQIRYLEDENRRLRKKADDEERRGDEYKDKYERLKDKYDD